MWALYGVVGQCMRRWHCCTAVYVNPLHIIVSMRPCQRCSRCLHCLRCFIALLIRDAASLATGSSGGYIYKGGAGFCMAA